MTDAKRAILEDYVDVFATPAGQRVLENMKQRAGYYGTKVAKGAPIEPTRLVWNEAQRAFVIETMNRATYDFSQEPVKQEQGDG